MTGSANYGTYESTEEELDTFLRHSIKPFMKRRLNELDSLRAKNEHLEEQLRLVRSVAVDFAKSLPRVITADELKVGQLVSIYESDTWRVDSGVVSRTESGGAIVRLKGAGATMFDLDRSQVDTIVLLADAPEPDFTLADWERELLDAQYADKKARTADFCSHCMTTHPIS